MCLCARVHVCVYMCVCAYVYLCGRVCVTGHNHGATAVVLYVAWLGRVTGGVQLGWPCSPGLPQVAVRSSFLPPQRALGYDWAAGAVLSSARHARCHPAVLCTACSPCPPRPFPLCSTSRNADPVPGLCYQGVEGRDALCCCARAVPFHCAPPSVAHAF